MQAIRGKKAAPRPVAFDAGRADINDAVGLLPLGAVDAADGSDGVFDLHGLIGKVDHDISEEIKAFYQRVHDDAIDLGSTFYGDYLDPVAAGMVRNLNLQGHIPEALAWIRRSHAVGLETIFTGIATEQYGQREAQEKIRDLYNVAYIRAEGVARTELAWAYEEAALQTFRAMGVEAYMWDFGGGPCTTGLCYELHGMVALAENIDAGVGFGEFPAEAEGGDFTGYMRQPPVHPSCTCCLIPADTDDYEAAALTDRQVPTPAMMGLDSLDHLPLPNLPSGDNLYPPGFDSISGDDAAMAEIRASVDDLTYDFHLGGGITAPDVYKDSQGRRFVVKRAGTVDPGAVGHPDIEVTNDGPREVGAYIINEAMALSDAGRLVDMPAVIQAEVTHQDGFTLQSILQEFRDNDGKIGEAVWEETLDDGSILDHHGYEGMNDDELQRLALFDSIIGMEDRHRGNGLYSDNGDGTYHFIAIDHGIAFPAPEFGDFRWSNSAGVDAAEDRGLLDISGRDDLLDALDSLLEQQGVLTQRLMDEGLEPEAIDDMFRRVVWMRDNETILSAYDWSGDQAWQVVQ